MKENKELNNNEIIIKNLQTIDFDYTAELKEIDFELLLPDSTWECSLVYEYNSLEEFGFRTKDKYNKEDLPIIFSQLTKVLKENDISYEEPEKWNIVERYYNYEDNESHFDDVVEALSSSEFCPENKNIKDSVLYELVDAEREELIIDVAELINTRKVFNLEENIIIETEKDRIIAEYEDKIEFDKQSNLYSLYYKNKNGKRRKISSKDKEDLLDKIVDITLKETDSPSFTTIRINGRNDIFYVEENEEYKSDPYIEFGFIKIP